MVQRYLIWTSAGIPAWRLDNIRARGYPCQLNDWSEGFEARVQYLITPRFDSCKRHRLPLADARTRTLQQYIIGRSSGGLGKAGMLDSRFLQSLTEHVCFAQARTPLLYSGLLLNIVPYMGDAGNRTGLLSAQGKRQDLGKLFL